MDTAYFKPFLILARLGSITKASAAIGCTKGALSKRVSQIEQEVGTQLFHHQRGKIELTPAGRSFVETAQKIVSLEAAIQQEVCGSYVDESELNVLSIGTPHYIAPYKVLETMNA